MGLSATYISLIENDNKKPSLDVLYKISDCLGIPYPILAFLSIEINDIQEDKKEAYQLIVEPFKALLIKFFI